MRQILCSVERLQAVHSVGKVPERGACAAECPSGCTVNENGAFNARLSFRASTTSGIGPGLLETYLYSPNRRNQCGDDLIWYNGAKPSSKWQFMQMYLRLNDLGIYLSFVRSCRLQPNQTSLVDCACARLFTHASLSRQTNMHHSRQYT